MLGNKYFFHARNIFTGKEHYPCISAYTSKPLLSPVVTKKRYTLLSIDEEGFSQLLNEDNPTLIREDLRLNLEQSEGYYKDKITQRVFEIIDSCSKGENMECQVTVISALGHEMIQDPV